MVVVLSLMGPCLLFKGKRTLAATLLILWVITRISLLPGDMNFAYQATAFFYTAGALFIMHVSAYSTQSILIATCFAVISLAVLAASLGILSLDGAGTIYELFGLFAMTLTIGPKDHGYFKRVFKFPSSRVGGVYTHRFRNSSNPNSASKRR